MRNNGHKPGTPAHSHMNGNGKSANGNGKVANGTLGHTVNWDEIHTRVAQLSATLDSATETPEAVLTDVWARRAEALARVPAQEESGTHTNLVFVQIGEEVYGLEVDYVHDIRLIERLTSVPRVPAWVAGVVNVRGRILSAIDLGRYLGLHAPAPDAGGVQHPPYLIVVEAADLELALLVNDLLAVESVPASRVQETDTTLRGLRADYVRGLVEYGEHGGMAVWLDLPTLLGDPQLVVHEEMM